MRDLPDADTLLALAAAALARADVTDAERALAARCRDIAAREREFGAAVYAAVAAELKSLYGEDDAAVGLRRLAAEIRAGRYDAPGPERARIERLLWALTVQKLRESNPGFLDGARLG
jgi:hypothetical protein